MVPFLAVMVDVLLRNVLQNKVSVVLEVIHADFVQGEVRVNVTTDVVRV